MASLIPKPNVGTSLLRALWCRFMHRGFRCHTGLPSAGRMLTHDICCVKCGAEYTVQTPNTPQYCHSGPWGKPDMTKPDTWFDKHGELREPIVWWGL